MRKVIVVGAGFAGAVCAERLANAGWSVTVIDKRPHIGGNAFDKYDENGVLIHPYGPHIFHTDSRRIFEYLSNFTEWRFYEHRVRAFSENKLYPIPINRTTINQLYGLDLTESQTEKFLAEVRTDRNPVQTSEDVVMNSVGEELCERFFRGYTAKQWGMDLSELSAGVAARIPTRTNDDDRYFTDIYQFMPADGYTALFQKMLDHPHICFLSNTLYKNYVNENNWDHLIFTGPIDEYYDYQFGRLPYRSIAFQHEYLPNIDQVQEVGTVNYPDLKDGNFTRITEFKHLTGQLVAGTSIATEFPNSEGDPYYPIPRKENEALYQKYKTLSEQEKNVSFVGRLAQYRYYNMDQVVGAALALSEKIIEHYKAR